MRVVFACIPFGFGGNDASMFAEPPRRTRIACAFVSARSHAVSRVEG